MKISLYFLVFAFLFIPKISAQEYFWTLQQSGNSLGGPIDVNINNKDNVYYGAGNTVYKSTDRGETFQPHGSPIPNSSRVKSLTLKYQVPGTFVVAVESSPNDKIYKTTDDGQTWVLTNDQGQMSFFGIPVTRDPSHPDTLYTMINNNFQRSTDFGSTWTTIASNFGPASAPCDIEVFADTSIILIGDNGTGIFRSTDYGITWSQAYSTSGEIPTIAIDHDNRGTAWATKWGGGGGFLKSTDYGASWQDVPSFGGTNMWGVHVNPNDGNEVITGCYSCGTTWRTKNGGQTWRQIPISSSNYQLFIADSMNIFSAQGSGIYKLNSPYFIPVELTSFTASAVDGKVELAWTTATELNNSGFEIERSSSVSSSNSGWKKIGFVEGFGTTTESKYYSFTDVPGSFGNYSYRLRQVDYDGTFEYSGQIEVELSAPQKFSLNQNYPNPFNPSTKISWNLASESFVTLKVFDILGNEVQTIINELKQAGIHQAEFNGSDLSSGIYFYKLTASPVGGQTDFSQIRKMSLIK